MMLLNDGRRRDFRVENAPKFPGITADKLIGNCCTVRDFTVMLSAMLPFAALHRAVSASASFILVLFI